MTRALAKPLLAWYDAHKRDLPWRRTSDPYAVWVSEIMLQQTQVATVEGYFERWMARFPTVRALAAATEDDVLHAWQGLGYYSRARNLQKGARAVVTDHGGAVPRGVEALRTLPGVGPYSAGAIASIAHGERAAIVDGNVVRVLCRVFGLRGDPTRAPLKAELWKRAESVVPETRPGDFNQAMMELGATVCVPRGARCAECPLRSLCVARRDGLVETLPELPKRREAVPVARAAAIVRNGGRVLVVQVPDGASRWAGMWQFPNTDVVDDESASDAAMRAVLDAAGAAATPTGQALVVRHTVTHYRITLEVFHATLRHAARRGTGSGAGGARGAGTRNAAPTTAWKTASQLEELAMPAAHRRIARFVEKAGVRK